MSLSKAIPELKHFPELCETAEAEQGEQKKEKTQQTARMQKNEKILVKDETGRNYTLKVQFKDGKKVISLRTLKSYFPNAKGLCFEKSGLKELLEMDDQFIYLEDRNEYELFSKGTNLDLFYSIKI